MGLPYTFLNLGVWNIHGLFTVTNSFKMCKIMDPEFNNRLKLFDILCLQEIQCGPKDTQPLQLQGYRLFSFHRNISSNNRYFGGSLIMIRNEIRNGIKFINNPTADKIWVKLKKDFFNLEKYIFVSFSYATPETSPYTKNLDYDIFQKLESEITTLMNDGNVILAGDMNAKTGTANDYVPTYRIATPQ